MAGQIHTHQTSLSFAKPAPAELYAGAEMALVVGVACPSKCDLTGSPVRIIAEGDTVVHETELAFFDGTVNVTEEFVVKAPATPGEYTWSAVWPAHERAGVRHAPSSASFSFVVKPHAANLAVWDVPSPVVLNSKFTIKVGVKCPAECALAGREVGVYDPQGVPVAHGQLGDAPWSETSALYWTEVALTAPGSEGIYEWQAQFQQRERELAHAGPAYAFSFRTVRAPEHVVTVEVVAHETQAPIAQADVIVHPYRGRTDERGRARLTVAKGEYAVYVTAYERQTFQTTVRVTEDVSIQADLTLAPVPDTSG